MKQFIYILGLFGILSCSTEVDVNAPFVETPIVYSLLDATQPSQIFRLQKAYSAEGGNAVELAKDPASIYYPNNDALLTLELFLGGAQDPSNSIFFDTLDLVLCPDCKEEGDFYSDNLPLYVTLDSLPIDPEFEADDLSEAYSAIVRFQNLESGHMAEGTTGIVSCFRIIDPSFRCTETVETTNTNFDDLIISFEGPVNGRRAIVTLVAEYSEDSAGVLIEKRTDPPLILVDNVTLNKGVGFDYTFDSYDSLLFGNYLSAVVDTSYNDVVRRRSFATADITFRIFNEDYDAYQLINNNFNPITQTNPTYTNVQNGLGLVGSVTQRDADNIAVNFVNSDYLDQWPSLKAN